MQQYTVSNSYLAKLVTIVSLTSSPFGIALVTTDALANQYKLRNSWSEDDSQKFITYLTCSSALGLMIGSLLSGVVVKMGRRKAAMLGNLVSLVGSGI